MDWIKFFWKYLVYLIKKGLFILRGKEIKVIRLDKQNNYKKIKVKKRGSRYKDYFELQSTKSTALWLLILFISLIFLYLIFGTWSITEWIFGGRILDLKKW